METSTVVLIVVAVITVAIIVISVLPKNSDISYEDILKKWCNSILESGLIEYSSFEKTEVVILLLFLGNISLAMVNRSNNRFMSEVNIYRILDVQPPSMNTGPEYLRDLDPSYSEVKHINSELVQKWDDYNKALMGDISGKWSTRTITNEIKQDPISRCVIAFGDELYLNGWTLRNKASSNKATSSQVQYSIRENRGGSPVLTEAIFDRVLGQVQSYCKEVIEHSNN